MKLRDEKINSGRKLTRKNLRDSFEIRVYFVLSYVLCISHILFLIVENTIIFVATFLFGLLILNLRFVRNFEVECF